MKYIDAFVLKSQNLDRLDSDEIISWLRSEVPLLTDFDRIQIQAELAAVVESGDPVLIDTVLGFGFPRILDMLLHSYGIVTLTPTEPLSPQLAIGLNWILTKLDPKCNPGLMTIFFFAMISLNLSFFAWPSSSHLRTLTYSVSPSLLQLMLVTYQWSNFYSRNFNMNFKLPI